MLFCCFQRKRLVFVYRTSILNSFKLSFIVTGVTRKTFGTHVEDPHHTTIWYVIRTITTTNKRVKAVRRRKKEQNRRIQMSYKIGISIFFVATDYPDTFTFISLHIPVRVSDMGDWKDQNVCMRVYFICYVCSIDINGLWTLVICKSNIWP